MMNTLNACLIKKEDKNELSQQQVLDILGLDDHLRLLLSLDPQIQYQQFGTNKNDEMKVIVDNSDVGIFKCYAIHLLPFIILGQEKLIADNLPQINNHIKVKNINFEQACNQIDPNLWLEIQAINEEWMDLCHKIPTFFEASASWAIQQSRLADIRLHRVFKSQELSENPKDRLKELILRLKISFQLTAPFYNLEAIMDDYNSSDFNPLIGIESSLNDKQKEGLQNHLNLDIIAKLLPSAFHEYLDKDFSDLSWDFIRSQTNEIIQRKDVLTKILMKTAILSQSSPENIMFAIHALNMIPSEANKQDWDPEIAQNQILSMDIKPLKDPLVELIRLGRKYNAFIRFQNRQVIDFDEENFQGDGWNYATTSDIPNQIILLIKGNPYLIKENYRDKFFNEILPQLQDVDAASARGRFVLGTLLSSGALDININKVEETQFGLKSIKFLNKIKNNELFIPLGEGQKLRSLNGGKISGLETAESLDLEMKPGKGIKITSEFYEIIESLDSELKMLRLAIDKTKNVQEAVGFGKMIQSKILGLEDKIPAEIKKNFYEKLADLFPGIEEFIIRSSQFFEDGFEQHARSGILESIRSNKNDLVKTSLAVFAECFSKKAVVFMKSNNYTAQFAFAGLLQAVREESGGVAFSRHKKYPGGVIQSAQRPWFISENSDENQVDISEICGDQIEHKGERNGYVKNSKLEVVRRTVTDLKECFGHDIDMEFVGTENLEMLQQRRMHLNGEELELETRTIDKTIVLSQESDISKLEGILFKLMVDEKKGIEVIWNCSIKLKEVLGDFMALCHRFPKKIIRIVHNENIRATSHLAVMMDTLSIGLKEGV